MHPAVRRAMFGLALAGSVGLAGVARAAAIGPFTVTTSGTIAAGSDTTNLLGAGTDLAGDAYTLTLYFSGLGASYYTDGTGQFAIDASDSIPGSITVTVAGHTLSTALSGTTSASLTEDLSDITDSNSGFDPAGDFVSGSQQIAAVSAITTYADLQTSFAYSLGSGDTGSDSYSFANATDSRTISFSGTPSSVRLQVPEPASWALLGAGLLGLGIARRRTRA